MRLKLLLAALLLAAGPAPAAPFEFVALGDMPYGNNEKTLAAYESLITEINARQPAFTIHVGDLKSGRMPCSDDVLETRLDYLNRFAPALIYTPGDNEWTDCHQLLAGRFDPLERLGFLRRTFFADPSRSLGTAPFAVQSQALVMGSAFAPYVENTRFMHEDVLFVQAHVVGSNNNFLAYNPAATAEHLARDRANLAWLHDSFALAAERGARAVVVSVQADMFRWDFDRPGHPEKFEPHSGFANFGNALRREAKRFARPVLLVYGDSHSFLIHRPFRRTAPNLIALQVFGARDMHAVRIAVDPEAPEVFSFAPLFNPRHP